MKVNKVGLILCLLVLSLAVVACGGNNDDTPNVTLPQSGSFSSEEYGITIAFNYPEGWVLGEEETGVSQIILSTSADVANLDNYEYADGHATGTISYSRVDDSSNFDAVLEEGEEITPTFLVENFITLFADAGESGEREVGDMVTFTIGGKDGAYQAMEISDDGGASGMIFAVVEVGENEYASIWFLTADGQSEAFVDELQAILGSVTVAEGAG